MNQWKPIKPPYGLDNHLDGPPIHIDPKAGDVIASIQDSSL